VSWLDGRQLAGLVITKAQSNITDDSANRLTIKKIKSVIDARHLEFLTPADLTPISNFSGILSNLSWKRPNGTFFVLTPMEVNLSLIFSSFGTRSIECVILDEGNGSYFSSLEFELRRSKLKYGTASLKTYLNVLKRLAINMLKKLMLFLFSVKVSSWLFFTQRSGETYLEHNVEFSARLLNALQKELKVRGVNKPVTSFSKKILILVDFSVVTESEMFDFLREMIEGINHVTTGACILLKAHPNSSIETYWEEDFDKIQFADAKENGEELLLRFEPDIIIGGWSSITFHAPYICSGEVLCIMPLYLKMLNLSKLDRSFIGRLREKMRKVQRITWIDNKEDLVVAVRDAMGSCSESS
jgi:hypothetical protein